ncbi:type II toxin-antitoxin system Phd/YefM family antitoxin [Actinomycetospora termitidis]|uniref:Antitoxin n=1 Tax=Actinomycetospora termitidis TaxID=3053470 RepID=A0ABT7MEF0_9PSEU|nr:type II toxin-antitoxin system prevent-host-death family antitoxin [Actinomycetospora sp. Odt1-22]MDL5159037.1 type II toxin-antitoxin system prevent-host-death family antitoxin [Actinomycetospora sp. Odt1-22]
MSSPRGRHSCHPGAVESVGLPELRQNASEIVRRVEAGERIEVTVSGRIRAVLVPAESRRWRSWDDVAAALDGPADPDRSAERDLIDHELCDPWAAG